MGHPGDTNKNDLLDPGESWTFTCLSNLTKTTTNLATAEGHANGLTATDFASATVVVTTPGLPNTGLEQVNTIALAVTQTDAVKWFTRSLDLGSEGTDVEKLQTILEQKGFLTMPEGVAKGYFGAKTRTALMAYQKSVDLPAVGVFGPRTTAKILAEYSK